MLDWPARMKTLIGAAKEFGERPHSSARVRITVGFIFIDSLVFRFFEECGLGLRDQFEEMVFLVFHRASLGLVSFADADVVLRSGG